MFCTILLAASSEINHFWCKESEVKPRLPFYVTTLATLTLALSELKKFLFEIYRIFFTGGKLIGDPLPPCNSLIVNNFPPEISYSVFLIRKTILRRFPYQRLTFRINMRDRLILVLTCSRLPGCEISSNPLQRYWDDNGLIGFQWVINYEVMCLLI